MQRKGGRLYGTVNTGQQEYDDVLSSKGVKPSVANQCECFLRPEQTLDQSFLNPSTCLNLKGAIGM
jgi:hypothetical protein